MVPSVTSPSSTWRRPETAFRAVVFPAPFDPSSAAIFAVADLEGEAAQDENHVVVEDLDVVEAEEGAGSPSGALTASAGARMNSVIGTHSPPSTRKILKPLGAQVVGSV